MPKTLRMLIEARRRRGWRVGRRCRNKSSPAVVIASSTYLVEHPDALVGILTTNQPKTTTSTDCVLQDWQSAELRAESYFRVYVLTMHRSPNGPGRVLTRKRDGSTSVRIMSAG